MRINFRGDKYIAIARDLDMQRLIKREADDYGFFSITPKASGIKLQKKSLESPDETRTFENGKVEVTTLGEFNASRFLLEPGWRWSENVKPLAGTDSCQVLHTGYQVSGRLHIRLEDGTEEEVGPGEAYVIPPGHDAWVVGDEPVVSVDMSSVTAERYAKE